jgi:hypothetical protein
MSPNPISSPRPTLRQQITPGRLALAAGVVVITLVLALALRDFVRASIVLPLYNFFWIIWLALQSLHQAVWWVMLLAIGLIVALRSLRGPRLPAIHTNQISGRGYTSSRYFYWRYGLESQALSPFSRERIRRDLQGLVLKVLASQLRTEPEEVRGRLQAGEFDLPQSVANLFVYTPPAPFELARRWDWLGWFRRPARAAGLDVEPILAWLEAQTNVRELDKIETLTPEAQRHGENL